MWQEVLGNKNSVHLEKWPEYNDKLIEEELVTIVVQVNGRFKDSFMTKKGLTEDEVKEMVLSREKIKKHLEGKEIKKFIYVKDKLTNIVI